MIKFFAAVLSALILLAPAYADEAPRTQWNVHASEPLDALLLLGAASGDLLQAEYYGEDIAWVRGELPAQSVEALDRLGQQIRDSGALTGPLLALIFSAGPIDSYADLIVSADDPEGRLRPSFEASPYWRAERWPSVVAAMPAISQILRDLEAAGFRERWREQVAPLVEAGVVRVREAVQPYDLIPEQERLLGRALEPGIEVIVLHYSQPYGIRITGQRFLNHHHYDAATQLRTAAHEIFHPPYDMQDPDMVTRLRALEADAWMRAIVEDHDPRFGYNSFEGVVNEDSTQALDQIVSERLGFARDPGERWRRADGGMHMLAAALYHAMKEDGFDRRGGVYRDWLASALDRGLLTPAEVRRRAAAIVGEEAAAIWDRPVN